MLCNIFKCYLFVCLLLIARRRFRQFRPEFLKLFCADLPLSSDALTDFGSEDRKNDEKDFDEAEKRMSEQAIPSLVKDLELHLVTDGGAEDSKDEKQPTSDADLYARVSMIFHRNGVNLWQLGEVRDKCQAPQVKQALLSVMVARALKCLTRKWMRTLSAALNRPIDPEAVVYDVLRVLFLAEGALSNECLNFWEKFVRNAVKVNICFLCLFIFSFVLLVDSRKTQNKIVHGRTNTENVWSSKAWNKI